MLVLKIVLYIVAIGTFFAAHILFSNNYNKFTPAVIFLGSMGGILTIGYCVLLIITNWDVLAIPKILLFLTICAIVLFFDEELSSICPVLIIITIIAFIVGGILYKNNYEYGVQEIITTRYELCTTKDDKEIIGNIRYVHGDSISKEDVYKFYYFLEDGGVKQGSIPVESTVIYFIKENEEPYLEEITKTEFGLNNNKHPAKRINEVSKTDYKLHIPEGTITEEYPG